MNVKNFLIDALTSALELGLATPDDVMKHVTPEILGKSLPRPLWSRLLIACLGAPRVDAHLVVETVGVQNLCEHVAAPIIYAVIAEVATRALGGVIPERPARTFDSAAGAGPAKSMPLNLSSLPPPEVRAERATPPPPPGPSIPTPGSTPDPDAEVPLRARTPTGQRFRQTNTNIGRLASSSRRPQASAAAPEPPPKRRAETEVEEVVEDGAKTSDDWRSSLAVEDDQLVDWSASEETQTSTEDRKR